MDRRNNDSSRTMDYSSSFSVKPTVHVYWNNKKIVPSPVVSGLQVVVKVIIIIMMLEIDGRIEKARNNNL